MSYENYYFHSIFYYWIMYIIRPFVKINETNLKFVYNIKFDKNVQIFTSKNHVAEYVAVKQQQNRS